MVMSITGSLSQEIAFSKKYSGIFLMENLCRLEATTLAWSS